MSVGVIITISASLAIYNRIEYSATNAVPREYNLDSHETINQNNLEIEKKKLEEEVYNTVTNKNQIVNNFISYGFMTIAQVDGNKFSTFKGDGRHSPYFLLALDLDSYNKRTGKDYKLNDGEVLLTGNQKFMLKKDKIKIGDKTYKIKLVDNFIPSNIAVETYGLVVKDLEEMQYLAGELKLFNSKEKTYKSPEINLSANWDIKGIDKKTYRKNLETYAKNKGFNVEYRDQYLSLIHI